MRTAAQIRLIATIADRLHGDFDRETAIGTRRGVAVAYRLAMRDDAEWTHVEAALPAGYPLTLAVRRHVKRDHADVASGQLVDIEVGDPAFDAAFLIEAAPADVARVLIDPPTRALLRAFPGVRLETRSEPLPSLRLTFSGWEEDIERAIELIDEIVGLAGRVREAYELADLASPEGAAGAPYRPEPDDRPDRRIAEVAQLDELRAGRSAKLPWVLVVMLIALGIAMLVAIGTR